MKEKEGQQNQNKLTQDQLNSTLNSGGRNMADGPNNGPDQQERESKVIKVGKESKTSGNIDNVSNVLADAAQDYRRDVEGEGRPLKFEERQSVEAMEEKNKENAEEVLDKAQEIHDALNKFRENIRNQWNEAITINDETPEFVKNYIETQIQAGMSPDRITSEQMQTLKNMLSGGDRAAEEDMPQAPAGAGGNGDGDGEPPAPPDNPPVPEDGDQEERQSEEEYQAQVKAAARNMLQQLGLPAEVTAQILGEAEERIFTEDREALTNIPESLEDLAKEIMKRSGPEWRIGGPKSLIKENGRVDTDNFLDWTRNNLIKVHYTNPTDPVNFFSDIGTQVRTGYYGSAISFYEITFGQQFFLRKAGKDSIPVVDKEYEALRNQVLMETFLLMLLRNPDITYTANRAVKEKMLEELTNAFAKNPLTRSNFLEIILTMPSTQRKALLEVAPDDVKRELADLGPDVSLEEAELLVKKEGNYFVGEAVRRATAAYMSIFSYEQLVEILGPDAVMFKRDYQQSDVYEGVLKTERDGSPKIKEISPDVTDPNLRRDKWFKPDGSLRLGKKNKLTRKWEESTDGTGAPHPDYMDYINVFSGPGPMPDQRKIVEVRERMVQSIMEKCGLTYREAQLAELFAYSTTHINGLAARLDTHSVAFDYWTRLQNLRGYRLRQKAEKRSSSYGLKTNIDGFKRIGFNFFEAARDIRKRSVQEIFLGGRGGEIDIDNTPVKDFVNYERDDKGVYIFRDAAGNALFRDAEGKLTDTTKEVRKYEIIDGSAIFRDAQGKVVDIGQATAKIVKERVTPIEFAQDMQKQFLPNHVFTGADIYGFLMEQVESHFADTVVGYDSRGNAIIDHEKLDKLKKGIVHDIRYMISTWPEINFDEEQLDWERTEVRDDSGTLIAKKKGENGETLYLDEDWYILDNNGNRTDERNEPELELNLRNMTRLESMFGVGALKLIQFELQKRRLTYSKKDAEKDRANNKNSKKVIKVSGWERGNFEEVEVDLSHSDSEEFKIAIWKGALEYLLTAEVIAHRGRESNLTHWNNSEIKKYFDAIVDGEVLTSDETGNIRKITQTEFARLLAQDSAFAASTGGLEGILKALGLFLRETVKE